MHERFDGRRRRRPRLLLFAHQVGDDVHGDWEHNGAVLFCGDVVQGLQVSQLKKREKDVVSTLKLSSAVHNINLNSFGKY